MINFGEMTEAEARRWPDLWSIVEKKVKPARLAQNRETRAKYWWRFGETSPGMTRAIQGLTRVLMHPFTSKYLAFAFVPSTTVIASPHCVFAISSMSKFAVLQSRVHEIWVKLFASSMEDRIRYTMSDCFETYPFPPSGMETQLDAAGAAYYELRARLMLKNNEGLTETYNRFHDPENNEPNILELRAHHAEMDHAVLCAYGWTDLQPSHEFLLDYEEDTQENDITQRRRKPWRYRWPDDFRDELLARLLELNGRRAQEEFLAGKPTATTGIKTRSAEARKQSLSQTSMSFSPEDQSK